MIMLKSLLLVLLGVVLVHADSWCDQEEGVTWRLFGTTCYGLVQKPASHGEAKNRCLSYQNGKLADVSFNKADAFVRTKLIPAGRDDSFWVRTEIPGYCETYYYRNYKTYKCKPKGEWFTKQRCLKCKTELKFICQKSASFKNTKNCQLDDSVNDEYWNVFMGKCYWISQEGESWSKGANLCKKKLHSNLAVADNEIIRNHLVSIAADNDAELWVNSSKNVNEDCYALSISKNETRPLDPSSCYRRYSYVCEVPHSD